MDIVIELRVQISSGNKQLAVVYLLRPSNTLDLYDIYGPSFEERQNKKPDDRDVRNKCRL